MKDLLKRTGSLLVIAGSLFLFALACAESPMAPAPEDEATFNKPVEYPHGVAKEDTTPRPPKVMTQLPVENVAQSY
jgi:hypothetical protein